VSDARDARERELGQATVELALVVPFVIALLLFVVQVALVARDQILVVHAARVAVREVAVGGPMTSARAVVVRSVPLLKQTEVSTETSYQGGSPSMVIVSVRYRSRTDVPLIGRLFPEIVVEAKAAMRDESVQTAVVAPGTQKMRQEARHPTWNPASVGQQAVTGPPNRTR
jgi:Flp pilus assembly protein TadG